MWGTCLAVGRAEPREVLGHRHNGAGTVASASGVGSATVSNGNPKFGLQPVRERAPRGDPVALAPAPETTHSSLV